MTPSVGPTAKALLDEAAQAEELTVAEILKKTKRPECVRARRYVMVQLRERGWSLTRIARVFGFDHTTVIHNLAKAREEDNAE